MLFNNINYDHSAKITLKKENQMFYNDKRFIKLETWTL